MEDSIARLPLSSGEQALLDAADLERTFSFAFPDGYVWNGRILDRKWQAMRHSNTTYAACRIRTTHGRKALYLHRVLTNAGHGQYVDHKDRNGLNNLRSNLRLTTQSQNNGNRGLAKGRRFKGIGVHKPSGKFTARCHKDGVTHWLGYHDTAEEAAIAYNRSALELFGEFARLNEVPA